MHFNEIFAPVTRLGVRLSAIAAQFNMKIHQLDVITASLNGKLDEEVLIEASK